VGLIYLIFFLPSGYNKELCTFNPMTWFILSFTNFFTGNLLFYLILLLLPTRRFKIRFSLTLLLFLIFLPFMTIYSMYGSVHIKAPNIQPTSPCVRLISFTSLLVYDRVDEDQFDYSTCAVHKRVFRSLCHCK
jgi:hypothetical protein